MSERMSGKQFSGSAKVDLRLLKEAYERSENITKLLRDACGNFQDVNDTGSIEIAYELQAGSYSQGALNNYAQLSLRAEELALHLSKHLRPLDVILDCGTGEMTTLSCASQKLPASIKLMAFDLLPSRLNIGRRFAARAMHGDLLAGLEVFTASMERIPLPDNSADVIVSNRMPLLREKDAILMCYE